MDLKGIVFLLLSIVFGFLYFKTVMAGNPHEKEIIDLKKSLKAEKESANQFIANQKKAYEEIIKKIKGGALTEGSDDKTKDTKATGADGAKVVNTMDAAYFKELNDENRKYHVGILTDLRGRIGQVFQELVLLFDIAFDAKKAREAWFYADLLNVIDPKNEIAERVLKRVKSLGYKNSFDMFFVKIPMGNFMMGTKLVGENKDNPILKEEEQHKVLIFKDFLLMDKEVTVLEWNQVMNMGVDITKLSLEEKKALYYPKVNVSYNEIMMFISHLNQKDPENNYRLPTEEEWEYACRAGSDGDYDNLDSLEATAWYRKNSSNKVKPTGELLPNGFGCFDMLGNVSEWVDGFYAPYGAPEATSGKRMYRGGSFRQAEKNCRAANRNKADANERSEDLGFRLVIQ